VNRTGIIFALLAIIACGYSGYIAGVVASDRYWSRQFAGYQAQHVAREGKRDSEVNR
jgi:hypothetical protein